MKEHQAELIGDAAGPTGFVAGQRRCHQDSTIIAHEYLRDVTTSKRFQSCQHSNSSLGSVLQPVLRMLHASTTRWWRSEALRWPVRRTACLRQSVLRPWLVTCFTTACRSLIEVAQDPEG